MLFRNIELFWYKFRTSNCNKWHLKST